MVHKNWKKSLLLQTGGGEGRDLFIDKLLFRDHFISLSPSCEIGRKREVRFFVQTTEWHDGFSEESKWFCAGDMSDDIGDRECFFFVSVKCLLLVKFTQFEEESLWCRREGGWGSSIDKLLCRDHFISLSPSKRTMKKARSEIFMQTTEWHDGLLRNRRDSVQRI
ncbi:hypothetical protein CEXT_208111 [Caerostris extrusa]|uniref:Uncharacterized protein n=1 Tax=Caerostris extrusa TaxID=172846 RepID=A0AAV4WGE4_CAEEX|nr:hypothetical protein CEXT_208111 [Caerostris extrusa]